MTAIPASYARSAAPVVAINCGAATIARIDCAQCGAHDEWRIAGRRPPSTILPKHFANQGWRLGKRPICPACAKATKHKEPAMKAAPSTPATPPTPDARAQRRDAHALIELTFDIAKGAFKDGYSDARIATETGVAEKWVKQRREDEFGPLKRPDEITELREQLADAEKSVAALKARFDALCIKQGWAA